MFQNGEFCEVVDGKRGFDLKLISSNVRCMGQHYRDTNYYMAYYITRDDELFVASKDLNFKFVDMVQMAKVVLVDLERVPRVCYVTKSNILKVIDDKFVIQSLLTI